MRQIFDPIMGVMDFGKKRVTDSRFNSKVHLAKEVEKDQETYIDLRRSRYLKTFNKHKVKTKSNLPEGVQKGLDSLKKRSKDGDLIIMQTDKSGKLAAVDPELYLKMGGIHTKNDTVIDMDLVEAMAKITDAHCSCWIKMLGVGDHHK